MARRDQIPLYDGTIKANRIGKMSRSGLNFDIVQPGHDVQGKRRHSWTQFVYEGIPVFEVKVSVELKYAIERFDELWDKNIKEDTELAEKALKNCSRVRMSRFKDGITGESPAPTLTRDGPANPNKHNG